MLILSLPCAYSTNIFIGIPETLLKDGFVLKYTLDSQCVQYRQMSRTMSYFIKPRTPNVIQIPVAVPRLLLEVTVDSGWTCEMQIYIYQCFLIALLRILIFLDFLLVCAIVL